MSSLRQTSGALDALSDASVDTLDAVLEDWQILADLSFSDLLMYCRGSDGDEFSVVAQMRPYTAQTIYTEDLVGRTFTAEERPAVARAFATGELVHDSDPDWSSGLPVRLDAVPVSYDGEVIAVVTREANLSMVRAPSQLELTYLQVANDLSHMLAEGTFPFPGERRERQLAPRVGDGMMRVDPSGVVAFASPNAVSAYRRLGVVENVVGRSLSDYDPDHATVLEALADGEPVESEVEARGTVVLRRLIPLTRAHRVIGGLMLVREVTDLRRHERLLLYKDATIREIHHRVKNNLQTVASLLRLQSRRLTSVEAQEALLESVRRISSIALVHETLSQDARQRVSFDKVLHRLIDMLSSGLTDPDRPIRMEILGDAGDLPAEVATPLALVVSELIQNAVEHGFADRGGTVAVELRREAEGLRLVVRDDGRGVPDGWDLEADARLGLRIALTLVESELGGTLDVRRVTAEGGTECVALMPLPV
jgi:two-component system, sensor histidine kinase PdtaS